MLANPGLATILATTVCLWTSTALAASKVETKPPRPCTIRSSVTDKFFDLNQIAVKVPKAHKDDREESWQARGYDFPANFTLNICAPVVEKVRNVVGVDEDRWQNVSAYYVQAGKTYSIGSVCP